MLLASLIFVELVEALYTLHGERPPRDFQFSGTGAGRISEISDVSLCLQRLDDLQNWHHFQTIRDNVWNFAVAYPRALVSLLYFFTSSFGFLLSLFIAFVSARFASWKSNF